MFEVLSYEVPSSVINKLCKNKELPVSALKSVVPSESFINLTCEAKGQSVLAHLEAGERVIMMNTKDLEFQGWKPRDKAQTCLFWALKNKRATVCFGSAGTGKTSIALAYGINRIFREEAKLVLCKPTVFVGNKSNAIAAVPGDERDKLGPYIDSYMPGLTKILGKSAEHYIYEWEEKGLMEFRAVELMRGQHFEKATLIIDEAQNLSLHELVSVLSRVDSSSRVIILGDPAQIDTGAKWHDTGLYMFSDSEAVFDSDLTAMVKLESQYRGPMAELCSEVLAEYNPVEEEDDFVFTLRS
tara:strand:- start:77 stop:973 length:897 start_codon:yes stop_codon:yes gene_type:complete